jgi:short-subunit dehydrogenase involved in D-alanine esterification of teichoic acids
MRQPLVPQIFVHQTAKMKTTGNTILITGATSGIGLEMTREFLKEGNTVIALGRALEGLDALGSYDQLFPWLCDLLKTSLDEVAKNIVTRFPNLNVLINNAGIQRSYESLTTLISKAEISAELYLNFEVPIQLTNQLLSHFFSRPAAAVINITSSLAIAPKRSSPFYCAAKAGLQVYTRVLRYHCENSSVKVIEVVPPLVDTNMTRGRGNRKISPDVVAKSVLAGMRKNKEVIFVGKAKLLRAIMRIAPPIGYAIMKEK